MSRRAVTRPATPSARPLLGGAAAGKGPAPAAAPAFKPSRGPKVPRSGSPRTAAARLVRMVLYGLALALAVGALAFIGEGLSKREWLNADFSGASACAPRAAGSPPRTSALAVASAPGGKALAAASAVAGSCAWKPLLASAGSWSPVQLFRVTALLPAVALEGALATASLSALAARYAGALEWAFLGGMLLSAVVP